MGIFKKLKKKIKKTTKAATHSLGTIKDTVKNPIAATRGSLSSLGSTVGDVVSGKRELNAQTLKDLAWNDPKKINRSIYNSSKEFNQQMLKGTEKTGRGTYHQMAQVAPGELGYQMRRGEKWGDKMQDDPFNNLWENLKSNVRGDPMLTYTQRKPTDYILEKGFGLNRDERMKLGGKAAMLGGTIGGYFGQGWIGPAIAGVQGIHDDAPAEYAAQNAVTGALAGYSGGAGKGAGAAASRAIIPMVAGAAVGAATQGKGATTSDYLAGAGQGAAAGLRGGYGGVATTGLGNIAQQYTKNNPQAPQYLQYLQAAMQAYGGNYTGATGTALNAYGRQQDNPNLIMAGQGLGVLGGLQSGNYNKSLQGLMSLYNTYQNRDRIANAGQRPTQPPAPGGQIKTPTLSPQQQQLISAYLQSRGKANA